MLRQAPAGAVGYRLVLPARSLTASPPIAPGPDAWGAPRFWRLTPFQLPDDLRLRDGHLYRILWVDAHGELLPPAGTRQLPALHFFLGPPDSPASQKARQARQDAAILRNLSDPAERSRCAAELVRLRLDALKERQQHRRWKREQARAQAELHHDAVRPQPLSQPMPEVQAIRELVSSPRLLEYVARGYTAHRGAPRPFPGANPGPSAGEPGTAALPSQTDPPLSEQDERTLCALVLDPELQAQLIFEQRAAEAQAEGKLAPAEPSTQLTAAERARIRRVATDLSLLQALQRFLDAFQRACAQGVSGLFNLPAPFRSLNDADKQWLDKVRFMPDQAAYLGYLRQHQQALLKGQPIPHEPASRLSIKQRNVLKQVVRDRRATVYLELTEAASPERPRKAESSPGES